MLVRHIRAAHLELIEDGIGALVCVHLGSGKQVVPDAGLHEELLEEGVHVACGAAVLDTHKGPSTPAHTA